jgi:hypothetical protein
MSHVEVEPITNDARPAIVVDNVDRSDFFAVTAPNIVPAFSLNEVTDLRIAWSRAAKDITLSKAIHLQI